MGRLLDAVERERSEEINRHRDRMGKLEALEELAREIDDTKTDSGAPRELLDPSGDRADEGDEQAGERSSVQEPPPTEQPPRERASQAQEAAAGTDSAPELEVPPELNTREQIVYAIEHLGPMTSRELQTLLTRSQGIVDQAIKSEVADGNLMEGGKRGKARLWRTPPAGVPDLPPQEPLEPAPDPDEEKVIDPRDVVVEACFDAIPPRGARGLGGIREEARKAVDGDVPDEEITDALNELEQSGRIWRDQTTRLYKRTDAGMAS